MTNPYSGETQASFLSRARKAVAGGIAAGVTALGTALAQAAIDGVVDQNDIWPVIGFTLAGAIVGFAGVYAAPKNANNGEKVSTLTR